MQTKKKNILPGDWYFELRHITHTDHIPREGWYRKPCASHYMTNTRVRSPLPIRRMDQDIENQETLTHLFGELQICNLESTKHLTHPTLPPNKMRNTSVYTQNRPTSEKQSSGTMQTKKIIQAGNWYFKLRYITHPDHIPREGWYRKPYTSHAWQTPGYIPSIPS